MALVNLDDTDAADWAGNTGVLAFDTPFQCQQGTVRITWDSGATFPDGMILEVGQTIIVPAGETVYYGNAGTPDSVLWYESFTS